jgi:type III secretion protein F
MAWPPLQARPFAVPACATMSCASLRVFLPCFPVFVFSSTAVQPLQPLQPQPRKAFMTLNAIANQLVQPETILMHKVSNAFTTGMVTLQAELEKSLAALASDPTNPVTLAQYQANISTVTLYRNAQSNTVKVLKDIDMNTIRNFV